jgi:ribosomal protein S12 methylthiotransferase accessory factor YcaO
MPLRAPRCAVLRAESNYKGLVRLYERYREFGLEVLAFPCNQVRVWGGVWCVCVCVGGGGNEPRLSAGAACRA